MVLSYLKLTCTFLSGVDKLACCSWATYAQLLLNDKAGAHPFLYSSVTLPPTVEI